MELTKQTWFRHTEEKRVDSAKAYTTTLLVMVDGVKREGVHHPPSPGWNVCLKVTIGSLFLLHRLCP